MPRPPMNAVQVLEREFLEIRAKILEVAAALDRIDRAEGSVESDVRAKRLADAIAIIGGDGEKATRAERVQLLFSREYDSNWIDEYQIESRS